MQQFSITERCAIDIEPQKQTIKEFGLDKLISMNAQQREEQGSIDSTQDSSISDIEDNIDNNDQHDYEKPDVGSNNIKVHKKVDPDAVEEADDDDDNNDDEDEEEEDGEDEDEDEEDEEEDAELDCADLLERAQDRIARQHLQDEVDKLHELLERKDTEIERLAGQLRRAISTKSELVEAHTDLERYHHDQLQQKDTDVKSLRRSNLELLEDYSNKEKALLNELVMLTEKLFESEKRHREEREDMIRRHTNEMLEKDFEIAQLTVKLQILSMKDEQGSVGSSSNANSKASSSIRKSPKAPPKIIPM